MTICKRNSSTHLCRSQFLEHKPHCQSEEALRSVVSKSCQLVDRRAKEHITVMLSPHCSRLVTAACPYPALRLDKLYAALIRCLVLWTVTKQILVFLFKGLYLLADGSDVTRRNLQRFLFALIWIRCDPAHTSLTVSSRAPALGL